MRKPAEFHDSPFPFPEGPCYRGVVRHVVDADTLDVFCDLGLYQYTYVTVRLAGINAPEVYGTNAKVHAPHGQEAKALAERLVLGKHVLITTEKDKQSFGRFVASITYADDDGPRDLAEALRAAGYDWTNR